MLCTMYTHLFRKWAGPYFQIPKRKIINSPVPSAVGCFARCTTAHIHEAWVAHAVEVE